MRVLLLIFCIALQLHALAQNKEYAALQVSPQPVKQSQEINIQFSPSKSSLNSADDVIFTTLFAYTKGQAVAHEVKLTPGKKKEVLRGKFTIPDSTDAIAIKFEKGEYTDNNNGNGYFFPVKDNSGKDIPATNYSMYRLYRGDYLAGIENPKPDIAKKYLENWLTPENITPLAYATKIERAITDKDTATLHALLKAHTQQKDLTEDQYKFFISYATRICKDPKLVEAIKETMQQQHPDGNWQFQPWADSMNRAATPAEKLVWVKAFKLAHPEDAIREVPFVVGNLAPTMLRSAMAKLDLKTFNAGLPEIVHVAKQQQNLAQMYNSIAWDCAKKDTLIAEALWYSKRSVMIIDSLKNDLSAKPAYFTPTAYVKNMDYSYNMYADTYGFLLLKKEAYDSAYHYLNLAATHRKFKDPEINERFFKAMENVKPAPEVLAKIEEAIMNDGYTSALEDQYKRVAKAANIADANTRLTAKLAQAKEKKYKEYKTKMINESAPAFSLVNLEGKPVSLESLKGKVVVVDFWATWCGPCIASFPGMQKVVNANKNDPDVEMLFINAWQSEPNKEEVVKKFIYQQPYSFNVLIDAEDKTIDAFKVNGIPTKFIIDKNGNIRFRSVGFNGNTDKTFEEMQMMIDLTKES